MQTEQTYSNPEPAAIQSTPAARLSLARFLGLTALFAIAYAQSPLYTSNQNQYFLHGLAQAGRGLLQGDWLANTLDPTPVFSLLVYSVAHFLQQETLFYLLYALLMGVYLFSLMAIVRKVIPLDGGRLKMSLFLAALILLHSAGLRFFLSRAIGVGWAYVLEDGVADQRLLGPVLQPSSFGVFLLLSIGLFLYGRPYLAVLASALAATVHPTYLLPAGLLTAAYLWVLARDERAARPGGWNWLRKPFLVGLLSLAAVLPIVLYTYLNFGDTPAATTAAARQILVHFRIPHHAVIAAWFDATVVFRLGLIAAALIVVRRTRLFPILLVASLGSAALTLVQALTNSDFLALIFPWRISAVLTPLSTALLAGAALAAGVNRWHAWTARFERPLLALSVVVIAVSVGVGGLRFYLDLERNRLAEERAVEAYVADTRAPGQVYLTPVKMQDFRLRAGAPVYVDFKSIPYADQDVFEWQERVNTATAFIKEGDCSVLPALVEDGVTHAVLDRNSPARSCPGLTRTWAGEPYSLYEISGAVQ